MIGFNGHQLMKFYLPMKPIKWDFKIHILVDCDNSYICSCILDPGKNNKNYTI